LPAGYSGAAGGCGNARADGQPDTASSATAANPTPHVGARSVRLKQGRGNVRRRVRLEQLRPVMPDVADRFAHRPDPKHLVRCRVKQRARVASVSPSHRGQS
jgi:hypothetical protein